MIILKKEFLDLKVSDPYGGKDIILRFLPYEMYKYYILYHPTYFEVIEDEKKNNKNNVIFK